MYEIKLRIAEIIIHIKSRYPLVKQAGGERTPYVPFERFNNFIYKGRRRPHIRIVVEVVKCLPRIKKAKSLFVTYHFADGRENWRLCETKKNYIYKSPLKEKKQLMVVSKGFDRVTAYVLPKNDGQGSVWSVTDIVYDFLQVLLINYCARKKIGIFTHAAGIKDTDGTGLIFLGKSGSGKTTTARLWHAHAKAMILNDDRLIVRKRNERFLIYGSPWHGDFHDYLFSRIESAQIKNIFFISHSKTNTAKKISRGRAFQMLYPAIFSTFWDGRFLSNILSLCEDLVTCLPSYSLGFVNDKRIIRFARVLCRRSSIKHSA